MSNSCDPMDCSLPVSSVHGILQARILEWVAISFSRGSSWPRDRTRVSCIAGRLYLLSYRGSTQQLKGSFTCNSNLKCVCKNTVQRTHCTVWVYLFKTHNTLCMNYVTINIVYKYRHTVKVRKRWRMYVLLKRVRERMRYARAGRVTHYRVWRVSCH